MYSSELYVFLQLKASVNPTRVETEECAQKTLTVTYVPVQPDSWARTVNVSKSICMRNMLISLVIGIGRDLYTFNILITIRYDKLIAIMQFSNGRKYERDTLSIERDISC